MEKLYAVMACGPNLCGAVAIFNCQTRAEEYRDFKNKQEIFSPTATKDANGISKAWLMGDGKYWIKETPSQNVIDTVHFLFKWD